IGSRARRARVRGARASLRKPDRRAGGPPRLRLTARELVPCISRARSTPGQRDVLRLRFLSAALGVPVLLGVTIVGGIWYAAAVSIGAILCSLEMSSMLSGAGFRPLT